MTKTDQDQDREAVEYMSRSIAEMVIEWVDNVNGLGWRVGLQKMIELRLSRLLKERDANERARAASAPQVEPTAWVNESHRDQIIDRSGGVYWYAPMMCGKKFEGSFPVYLAASAAQVPDESFQARVDPWMQACFGPAISADRLERGDRLLEEVLELLQSGGYPAERVGALTGYVWSRPAGEPAQEVGGVMVTLATYCLAHGLDMHEAGERELARIWTKVEKIRAKQAAKPTGSALPQAWPAPPPEPAKAEVVEARKLLEKAVSALDYFADAVFNDNGDMTVTGVSFDPDKHILAYQVRRRILSALATPPTAPAVARSAAEEMRERCAKFVIDARGEFGSVQLAERIMGIPLPGEEA